MYTYYIHVDVYICIVLISVLSFTCSGGASRCCCTATSPPPPAVCWTRRRPSSSWCRTTAPATCTWPRGGCESGSVDMSRARSCGRR